MKKLLAAALLVAFFVPGSWAQIGNFRIGVQASPSFNWTTTDDNLINRTGTNLGVTVGALGEYYFSEKVSLTAGLALAFGKGGTLLHDVGGNLWPDSDLSSDEFNSGDKPLPDGVKLKYSLQHLEFPLGLKFRSKEYGYLRYYLEAPILTWGVRLQARGSIDAGDLQVSNENISGDVNFLNLTWGFGAGVEYAISENNSLQGGLYFSRGFTDMTGDTGQKARDNPDQRPSDPDDDFIFVREDSKALLNTLTLRMAILF